MTPVGLSPFYSVLNHASLIDYPGCMAAVFFVAGCNFRCRFCHNASLLSVTPDRFPWTRIETLCRVFDEQWVDAAVLTGGEPTLAERLEEAIEFFHRRGWRVKVDTNGSQPSRLERLLPALDYVAMDVKASPPRYRELTGCDEVKAVSESLRLIRERAQAYELRITVIEGFHDEAEMRDIGAWIAGARRVALQPFVPRPRLPDPAFERRPRTSPQWLTRCADVLRPFVGEVTLRGV